MGAVVSNLGDQPLPGEPLQQGHHRGVGQFALGMQAVMDLPNGLWFVEIPQLVHHGAFQRTEAGQLGQRRTLSMIV